MPVLTHLKLKGQFVSQTASDVPESFL